LILVHVSTDCGRDGKLSGKTSQMLAARRKKKLEICRATETAIVKNDNNSAASRKRGKMKTRATQSQLERKKKKRGDGVLAGVVKWSK
jgi:hypothetical protein